MLDSAVPIIVVVVVVVVVVYIFCRIRRTSCRVDKNNPHCHFIYTYIYIYILVKTTVKMMLVHHPILQSLKSLKNTGVARVYHGFQYTGARFSGLSFSISFSTWHHRKSV